MRILGAGVENVVKVQDPVGGDSIRFVVDVPDTEMRAAFFAAAFDRSGEKLTENKDVRREFGGKIIKGFKGTPFSRVADERAVPVSSDPSSPDYFDGWKALLLEFAPELVEAVANSIFLGLSASGEQEYNEKN